MGTITALNAKTVLMRRRGGSSAEIAPPRPGVRADVFAQYTERVGVGERAGEGLAGFVGAAE